MYDYAIGKEDCRRKFILKYFGEGLIDEIISNYQCCDLCDEKINKSHSSSSPSIDPQAIDISLEVYQLLTMVWETRGLFGLAVPISLLLGRHDKKSRKVTAYQTLSQFSKGSNHSEEWWKELASQLTDHDRMMTRTLDRSATVGSGGGSGRFAFHRYSISEKGLSYLVGRTITYLDDTLIYQTKQVNFDPSIHKFTSKLSDIFLKAHEVELAAKASNALKRSNSSYSFFVPRVFDARRPTEEGKKSYELVQQELARRKWETVIRGVRKTIADRMSLPPYLILSSEDILKISFNPPSTADQLCQLLNWTEWKKQFAEEICQTIAKSREEGWVADKVTLYQPKYQTITANNEDRTNNSSSSSGDVDDDDGSNYDSDATYDQHGSRVVPPQPKKASLSQSRSQQSSSSSEQENYPNQTHPALARQNSIKSPSSFTPKPIGKLQHLKDDADDSDVTVIEDSPLLRRTSSGSNNSAAVKAIRKRSLLTITSSK
jgi:hypothetical protein